MKRGALAALAAATFSASLLAPAGAAAQQHTSPVDVRPAGSSPLASPSAVIGGNRWPGRVARITYFDGSEQRWAVKQAVKAWNTSGARIRLVPAPRRRAKLVIRNAKGPRSDSFVSGFASLGYVYPGGAGMQLSRLEHPRKPHYNMAGVVAHEFGHVLGLDHEDRRCATMNTVLWAGCGDDRSCRLLERDDIAGAVKMYGGRVRMKRPGFCPKPPSDVRVVGDPREYAVSLAWTNPRGPFFERVQIVRGRESCPKKVAPFGGLLGDGSKPGGPGSLRDGGLAENGKLATGRYCYSLFSSGSGMGLRSKRRTIWVDFAPQRPAAPSALKATPGPTGEVNLSWTSPPHPELASVRGAAALGVCPANPDDYFFEGDTSASTQLDQPGRYCIAVWSIDSLDAASGPATVWLDYNGQPPVADFSGYAWDDRTAYFSDWSYDPDGEIVKWQWNFGDGGTSAEQSPEHTYTAPGTYTVRLTVTDANGVTGTVTKQLPVPGETQY